MMGSGGGRGGRVHSCGHGTTSRSAATCDNTAVTPSENPVDFSRSLTSPAADRREKSSAVSPDALFSSFYIHFFIITTIQIGGSG